MNIKIGPAGWAYKDWDGIVYPAQIKKDKHPVEYLARYFDLIEINTSFYGKVRPEVAKLWCRKAKPVNSEFIFTFKLNKAFTHSPIATVEPTSAKTIRFTDQDEDDAKGGLQALAEENMLGALLMQFPISFKNTEPNRDHLELLIRQFREYPMAVEVRHSSWSNPEVLEYFTRKGIAFCNIDQPLLGSAVEPSEHVTSDIGYVRLHGRRYDQWFEPEKSSDRYDYLYTVPELMDWKAKISAVAKKANVTFVVANNHFEGKAPANALELKSMITGQKVKAPQLLVNAYPRLAAITDVEKEERTTLF